MNSSDDAPSSGSRTSRESLVDTGCEERTRIEEELQRDDGKSSKRGGHDLGLIGTAVRMDFYMNLRHADLDQTDRDVDNYAADNELGDPAATWIQTRRSHFD